jgi:aminoglycoside phosphotransferase (APT) family kinase protein
VRAGKAFAWADELAEAREELARLAVALPELGGAGEALLIRLEAVAAAYPPDAPVPTHGAFHCGQVLLSKGQIGFIDFDEFCQAEPGMDLGRFIATTKDVGLGGLAEKRQSATDAVASVDEATSMERICDRFLAQYERLNPVSRQRVALWEALHLFTLLLHCWYRVKPVRLDRILLMLERTLVRLAQAAA